ncbi:E3 ubiquitin-protein ligase RSP5 [Aplysia californica]|uniref:E3 ubiquitin-protein ligase RSP5 n=1 Tax=Aplysia californica TaxID=6500 RepID=A0ABM1VQI7_APLCA|nr:E3 ubiquitin-protein ligase RSP5 [Aplysia californica]
MLLSGQAVSPGRRSTTNAYLEGLLSDKVIVQLTLLQGKDLVAMDRNGYSDPFCTVSVGGKKVFTTAVKKKTLFPKWNETVTTELSKDCKDMIIDVYDKDMISNDFMGKLALTVEQLKELSLKGTSDWYTLDKAKTGKIQLRCQVIAKDTLHMGNNNESEEVFEYPPLDQTRSSIPAVDVTDSSFLSSREASTHQPSPRPPPHRPTQTPAPPHKYLTLQAPPKNSSLQRSSSDLAVDQRSDGGGNTESRTRGRRAERDAQTPPTNKRASLRHAGSSNSVNVMQRSGDDQSMVSSTSSSHKMFSVTGRVQRIRGNFPLSATDVYCKVRLEIPGNRLSIFHNSRIIGKSGAVSLSDATPVFDTTFEIDRGSGIPLDTILTFDLKHSSKEHLATKGFSLVSLLGDADSVCKWLPMGNGIELEVSLTQGQPAPHRRSSSLFKSFSFRKDK